MRPRQAHGKSGYSITTHVRQRSIVCVGAGVCACACACRWSIVHCVRGSRAPSACAVACSTEARRRGNGLCLSARLRSPKLTAEAGWSVCFRLIRCTHHLQSAPSLARHCGCLRKQGCLSACACTWSHPRPWKSCDACDDAFVSQRINGCACQYVRCVVQHRSPPSPAPPLRPEPQLAAAACAHGLWQVAGRTCLRNYCVCGRVCR